jgi:hypothetical protein
MFSCFLILSQTKFEQLPQTKSNGFKAVLIFEETVAMRIQYLELKKSEKYMSNRVFTATFFIVDMNMKFVI